MCTAELEIYSAPLTRYAYATPPTVATLTKVAAYGMNISCIEGILPQKTHCRRLES